MTSPEQRLRDLSAVQTFYLALLREVLGHPIPVPDAAFAGGAEGAEALECWLNLMDLAITPVMLRDALKETTKPESAEALLRYFVAKKKHGDADRDKTDFIVTFLYRVKVPAEKQAGYQADVDVPSEFEEEVYAMLGREEVLALPEEHRQLIREFPFIRDEVEDFRHFDQLMDSGILQRVREMKQRFGASFYHPRVLAIVAGYNVFFGRQFDELFRKTAQHIKQFASAVQQQGGSISSRVDGDVTVKHLAEVREGDILRTEYGRAQEHFRTISKFKKAVDSRTGAAHPRMAAAAAAQTPPVKQAVLAASVPSGADHLMSGVDPTVENGKLLTMEDSIRNFILAADPKAANIVPLRNANLALTGPEVDAFRAHYGNEKSFRADFAAVLRHAISLQARFMSEQQEFAAKQSSAYLWKPHADALTWLMMTSQKVLDECTDLLHTAEHRGLTDKATAINNAMQRVRTQVQAAAKALQGNGENL